MSEQKLAWCDEMDRRIATLERAWDSLGDQLCHISECLDELEAKHRVVNEAMLAWMLRGSEDNLTAALREALK